MGRCAVGKALVCTGVDLQRRITVAVRHQLREVFSQKRADAAGSFVLMDVAKLVHQQTRAHMAATNQHGMAGGEAQRCVAQQAMLARRSEHGGVGRQREVIDFEHADTFRRADADPVRELEFSGGQGAAACERIERQRIDPGAGFGQQNGDGRKGDHGRLKRSELGQTQAAWSRPGEFSVGCFNMPPSCHWPATGCVAPAGSNSVMKLQGQLLRKERGEWLHIAGLPALLEALDRLEGFDGWNDPEPLYLPQRSSRTSIRTPVRFVTRAIPHDGRYQVATVLPQGVCVQIDT